MTTGTAQGLQRRQAPEGLSVTIDPADRSRLVFSRRVTLAQAIAFLWPRPPSSQTALVPDPAERAVAGAQRRFIIDTSNQDALLGLWPDVMSEFGSITPIRAKEPAPLPAWLPLHVRQQILGFSLPEGVHRFAGTDSWGDIVVWIRRGDYMRAEAYQEFPETVEYYLAFTGGDHWTANLLLDVYMHFNSDMSYFVEQKGMSPSEARAEIRRINNEVFKLVLEASATIMATGASISAMNATMRTMSPKIVARADSTAWRVRFKPLNGKVNVGGGGEMKDMTNLNSGNPTSGGPPPSAIPNLVHARMEQMDEMFEPGSVTYLFSKKIRYGDFDWPRGAKAAFNVMAPGSKVEMNIMCDADEGIRFLVPAFEKAGFKGVRSDMFGPATKIHAVR